MPNFVRVGSSFDDKISGPLDRIRDKFRKARETGAKGFAIGAAAGLAAGAVGLVAQGVGELIGRLGDARQAYLDEEASVRRLGRALQNNAKDWAGNSDAVEQVIASRMRLGFSDDEQRESLAKLVVRTKDSTKALEIQRLAMDLARQRGMSLADASELVGKAYSGQVGALRRAGIAIASNATATEALAAIQKAAQGAAEDFAASEEGRLAVSQVKAGEAMEKLGKIVTQVASVALPILADALTFVIDVVANVASGVQEAIRILGELWGGITQGVQDVLRPLAQLNDFVGSIPGPWQTSAGEVKTSAEDMAAATRKVIGAFVAVRDRVKPVVDDVTAAIRAKLKSGEAVIRDGAVVMAAPIKEELNASRLAALKIAQATPGELADAIRGKRGSWQDAVEQLGNDLEHEMTTAAEMAKIKAELAGENLAKGLRSKDPVVRAQAEQTKAILEGRLTDLVLDAQRKGTGVGRNFASGINSTKPAVNTAGKNVSGAAKTGLTRYNDDAYKWGRGLGSEYAKGLRSTYGIINEASKQAIRGVVGPMKPSSPPKEGPARDIDRWGPRLMRVYADGIARGRAYVRDAAAFAMGGLAPGVPAAAFVGGGGFGGGGFAAMGGGGGATHVHFHLLEVPTAEAQRRIARMVVTEVTREQQRQGFLPRRAPTGA